MKANCFDTANIFTENIISKIYKLTHGNYRETNKLLYTLFDIYLSYEDKDKLSARQKEKISTKFIEMAAIHTGILNA